MNDRAEPVLAAALERLVEAGTLTPEQADAVRTSFGTDLRDDDTRTDKADNSWSLLLTEVGGYVGAAFVVAAAFALIGPNWDRFSEAGRIAVLAGPAVLLLVAAAVVAGALPGGWSRRLFAEPQIPAGPRQRLVGALVLAGGGLLAGAAWVVGEDLAPERWVPLVALLVWGIGYLLFRGVVLHVGAAVAVTWTALAVLGNDLDWQWPASGLLLVLAGAGWAGLVIGKQVEERALGFAVAGVMAFIGGEVVVVSGYEGYGYLLLGLLAVAGLVAYLRTREITALGVGATALAVVVPQAVIDYTEGSLGAAGALLVSGLSIVAVSALAARLRRTTSGPAELV